jgi:hypothetical protein
MMPILWLACRPSSPPPTAQVEVDAGMLGRAVVGEAVVLDSSPDSWTVEIDSAADGPMIVAAALEGAEVDLPVPIREPTTATWWIESTDTSVRIMADRRPLYELGSAVNPDDPTSEWLAVEWFNPIERLAGQHPECRDDVWSISLLFRGETESEVDPGEEATIRYLGSPLRVVNVDARFASTSRACQPETNLVWVMAR